VTPLASNMVADELPNQPFSPSRNVLARQSRYDGPAPPSNPPVGYTAPKKDRPALINPNTIGQLERSTTGPMPSQPVFPPAVDGAAVSISRSQPRRSFSLAGAARSLPSQPGNAAGPTGAPNSVSCGGFWGRVREPRPITCGSYVPAAPAPRLETWKNGRQ